ncbi:MULTISPECIES: hypothetical protein [unclassified Saccharothrix]|uniref:hypothetical protein n=1 Tax=unclassified Saccharothrix TaxID=2593673 RepID=UPI00307ED596
MSADFFEAEGGGRGDWLDGYEPGTGLSAAFGAGAGSSPGPAPVFEPGRGFDTGSAPAFGRGGGSEPAYSTRFGWAPPLVPLPRRAPDELF